MLIHPATRSPLTADQIQADSIYSSLDRLVDQSAKEDTASSSDPSAAPDQGSNPDQAANSPKVISVNVRTGFSLVAVLIGYAFGYIGLVPWMLLYPAFYVGWVLLRLKTRPTGSRWAGNMPTWCEWHRLAWLGEGRFHDDLSNRDPVQFIRTLSFELCYSARRDDALQYWRAFCDRVLPSVAVGNLIQLLPFTEFEGSASWLEPGISDLVVGSSDSLYSEILVRRHSLYADLRATIIEHDSGYKQPWTQAYVDILNVLDSVVQGAWQGKESGIRSADQIQYGLTPYRQTVPQANLLVQFADTIEASLRVESFSQIGSVASEWSALQRELVALPSSGRVAGQIALFQVCATSLPADPDPTPITLGQTALRLFEIEDALVTAGGDSPERLGSTALHLVFRHWRSTLIALLRQPTPRPAQGAP